MRLLALIAGAGVLTGAVSTLPTAPAKHVVTLTAKPGFYSEPAVAIDPSHPQHVLAAYQVAGDVAYSHDAGRTWHTVEAVPKHDHRLIDGDVSLAFDTRGRALLCYIAFDKLGTEEYWAHGASRNGIFVERSPDGGAHWEPHAIAVDAVGAQRGMFEDKPLIVADAKRGYFYIGWTEFGLGASRMMFSRSTDGGATWSHPTKIDAQDGLPRDDNGALEGFTGVAAPDGTLFVAWQDGTHILLSRSSDGGAHFERPRPIVDVPSMNFAIAGYEGRGGNGFPQLAIDPKANRLFLTWSDYRNGGVDVFAATSSDAGASWSAPVRVNDDPVHNGRDHLFQWLAVDPSSGDAYVIFDDRRGGKTGIGQTLTLARSVDGGRTFRNYAWTSQPFIPTGQFMGDYNGIAAYGGRVYGVWTEVSPGKYPAGKPATVVKAGISQF